MKRKNEKGKNFIKCSFCDTEYDQAKAIILEEKENKTVLHITCVKCYVSTIIFVFNNNIGIVGMGMATDMNANEAKLFFKEKSISTDEVIGVYEFFKNFKNEKLFLKNSSGNLKT